MFSSPGSPKSSAHSPQGALLDGLVGDAPVKGSPLQKAGGDAGETDDARKAEAARRRAAIRVQAANRRETILGRLAKLAAIPAADKLRATLGKRWQISRWWKYVLRGHSTLMHVMDEVGMAADNEGSVDHAQWRHVHV